MAPKWSVLYKVRSNRGPIFSLENTVDKTVRQVHFDTIRKSSLSENIPRAVLAAESENSNSDPEIEAHPNEPPPQSDISPPSDGNQTEYIHKFSKKSHEKPLLRRSSRAIKPAFRKDFLYYDADSESDQMSSRRARSGWGEGRTESRREAKEAETSRTPLKSGKETCRRVSHALQCRLTEVGANRAHLHQCRRQSEVGANRALPHLRAPQYAVGRNRMRSDTSRRKQLLHSRVRCRRRRRARRHCPHYRCTQHPRNCSHSRRHQWVPRRRWGRLHKVCKPLQRLCSPLPSSHTHRNRILHSRL